MKYYSISEDQLKTMTKNCGCPKEGVNTVGNIFIDCNCSALEQRVEELADRCKEEFILKRKYRKALEEIKAETLRDMGNLLRKVNT